MVVDVVTFNGEFDLLEIRLNILDPYVDQFILCEAFTTFSGKSKPLFFDRWKEERFEKWLPKIKYFVIQDDFTREEIYLAETSPNTQYGNSNWMTEFLQKERIKKALKHLNDEDIVLIGDCDEIWNPEKTNISWKNYDYEVFKINLLVYVYYLNNRSTEEFDGPIMAQYKSIKDECLNHIRTRDFTAILEKSGWHFTSMANDLKRKLEDSYTKETYANDWVMNNLEENVKNNKDFLGRDFKYWIDESEWPQYLKDNREKYKHLLK